MNKIYKVIWSKVRNCYVAVSEIAKRNGKGGGAVRGPVVGGAAVNCGAKGRRGRVMPSLHKAGKLSGSLWAPRYVAAALALAALCAVPGHAMANSGGDYNNNAYIGGPPSYTVVIDSDVSGAVYGGYSFSESATGSTVNMTGGTVDGAVFGGCSGSESVTDSTVNMTGGTVKLTVYGGYSGSEVTSSTVNMSGGTVQKNIYGGLARDWGSATGNTVNISQDDSNIATSISGNVYGGSSDSGNAIGNTVSVTGGTVDGAVFGGKSNYGSATDNTVILSKQEGKAPPELKGTVYGGLYDFGGGDCVTGNTLQVEAAGLSAPEIRNFEGYSFVLPDRISAGDTMLTLTAQSAGLTIDGSKVSVSAASDTQPGMGLQLNDGVTLLEKTGGSGTFTVNNVPRSIEKKLDGSPDGVTESVYKVEAPAGENKLNLTVTEKYLYGDGGSNMTGSRLLRNTLTIADGEKATAAFGGRTNDNDSSAMENKVTMTGGELVKLTDDTNPNYGISGNLYGGYAAGYNNNCYAMDNTVIISGGTVGRAVYGGYSKYGDAMGNTVDISGGTIGEVVNGEEGYGGAVYGGYSERGKATGNTVVLGEGLTDKTFGGLFLYGGRTDGSGDAVSGNTLQVEGRNIQVYAVKNFENYKFILPQSVKAGDTILGFRGYDGDVIIDGGKVSVYSGGRLGLNLGESVTLLKDTVPNRFAGGSEFILNDADKLPVFTERLDNEETGFVTLTGKTEKPDRERELNLTITEKYLYGSGGTNTPGQREKDNTLNITDGMKATEAYGGRATSGDVTGNTVNMSGGTVKQDVFGGYSDSGNAGGAGEGEGNTVNISGGTVQWDVIGGESNTGSATGNTVTISGGTVTCRVRGGYSHNGNATGNTVIISGGTVNGFVSGGNSYKGNATGNTVVLSKQEGKAAPVLTNWITGGWATYVVFDAVTGNTLQLEATGLSAPKIQNFETIRLAETLEWENDATVFEANQFNTNADDTRASLDVTDATKDGSEFVKTATDGQMTLLSSDTAEDFKTLSLVYFGGTEALSGTNLSKVVKTVETPEAAPVNGVTVTTTSTHTVSLDAENSYKNVFYTVESVPTKLTLGEMAWGTGRDLAGKYTFGVSATINAANLSFTGAATTALKKNDSAALVSNATGITAENGVTQPGTGKGTVAVDYTDAAGINFAATASGHVAAAKDAVNYVVDGVAVNSVDLQNWNGTTSTVTEGWTGSGVPVAGSFATAGVASGDILTATAGFFADENIDAAIRYEEKEFSDAQSGTVVTLAGHDCGGVKAEGSGAKLSYYAPEKKVETAILNGTVAWNTGGTYFTNDDSEYKFSDATKIDASKLAFEQTSTALVKDDSMTLLSAGGLTADNGVTQPTTDTGKTVAVDCTDGAGIHFAATASGHVAAAKDAVNYVVDGVAVDSVNLANWKGATSVVTKGWTGSGVAVNTGSFAEPEVAKGGHLDILATDKKGFFGQVTGDKEFKENEFADDTAKGVTLSGNKFGGVKATNDNKTLTYYAETMGVKKVALGTVEWGTGRAAAEGYDFTKVTAIDASKLEFTNPEEVSGSMDLLTEATNLAAGTTVDYGEGKTGHAQDFEKALDNKAVLSATLTGTVSVASETVSYASTGTAVNKIDLAGWDGETASEVPTGWTIAKDGNGKVTATVETDGMNAPEVKAGEHKDILQSDTVGFFAGVKINGANAYKTTEFMEKDSGITFNGTQEKGVKAEGKNLVYAVGTKDVSATAMTGALDWSDGGVHYANTEYRFKEDAATDLKGLTFNTVTEDPSGQSMTLIGGSVAGTVANAPESFGVTVTGSNTVLEATAAGEAAIAGGDLSYAVTGVTLDKVTVKGAGDTVDTVPDGWTLAKGATVETKGMTAPELKAGEHKDILQSDTAGFFAGVKINGDNAYKTTKFTESDPAETVTIAGSQGKGVTLNEEKNHIIYALGTKDVDTVTLGKADFAKDATLFDRSGAEYNYAKVKALGVGKFAVSYDKPETVAAGDTMTLLKANQTLADMAAQTKTNDYEFTPVAGVQVNAAVRGSLSAKGGAVTYRAEENKAGKLTFTDVDWKDSGALLTRPSNIVFAGADVDTAKIRFKNIESLEANKKMTLVSDFGDSVGTITGSKYMVGTALEGEGAASLTGSDLIFTAKTGTGGDKPIVVPQEQTHKTVMAMEAGLAMLGAGSEHVGKAMAGLGAQENEGADGTSTFASAGGGSSRYETGSHVDTHSWNALVAVGRKNETEKGSLEYGLFGEYGKGGYTLHSNAGRGDGDAHYAGGGLLAKWTNKHNVYTEVSFRLGRMKDNARDILTDGINNYGYNVHANYYGGHVGLGKVFSYKGGRSLDVYGKYFYTKRDGVSFDAGADHYDLDSVCSSLLRIGARYGSTDRKWNWYGGLAYEYEFDGQADGTVTSGGISTAIRSASVKGGSVRGELGLRMDATKTNPWKADISVYGYGGRHRGFGGNVNVAYTF